MLCPSISRGLAEANSVAAGRWALCRPSRSGSRDQLNEFVTTQDAQACSSSRHTGRACARPANTQQLIPLRCGLRLSLTVLKRSRSIKINPRRCSRRFGPHQRVGQGRSPASKPVGQARQWIVVGKENRFPLGESSLSNRIYRRRTGNIMRTGSPSAPTVPHDRLPLGIIISPSLRPIARFLPAGASKADNAFPQSPCKNNSIMPSRT